MTMKKILFSLIVATVFIGTSSLAKNIRNLKNVELKVGQSVVLKGVRHKKCDSKRPPITLNKFPKSKLGKFNWGKIGTVNSKKCGKPVIARAIVFNAVRKGQETLTVYKDSVRITVK